MSQCSSGDDIVLLAAALAISISKGMAIEDINILSNFFSALGDNLGIIAAKQEACIRETQTAQSSASRLKTAGPESAPSTFPS